MPFQAQDLFLVLFLAFLETILSIDNALVLAMMAKHLPPAQQKRALTYGLLGSVVFRLIALAMASYLMEWRWVKLLGGGYLVYVGASHLIKHHTSQEEDKKVVHRGFWYTVLMIEIMDIAFAVDSILAAIALTNQFWLIFAGGMIGVLMIRFAASFFLKVLQKYPTFEVVAYSLVTTIGVKLCVDWLHLPGVHFEDPKNAAFWIFWGLMLAQILYGFKPARRTAETRDVEKALAKEDAQIDQIESETSKNPRP